MTDLTGKQLGDFEIVRELGRGGMGVVYEARQISLNRRVALKVLGATLGPNGVGRFQREAAAAAKLHHTNIVPVYATGEQDGTHFYAMELIEGPSLDHVIRQYKRQESSSTPNLPAELTATGPYFDALSQTPSDSATSSSVLSSRNDYFDSIARMIADVGDALNHAHASGILHRDIKPANLLLGKDGRLSVNDFGLARLLEEPGMTVTGEFVGTPAYMSPEQVTAGRIRVDHRTDIYSLGATLYELLTLRPPFQADSRDRLLAMVIQKEPTLPRKLNPKVPRDLETICLKCLEKDPDRRYANAKDLANDLRNFINRFAISAKRVGPVGRLKKWIRRHPGLSGATAVAVVLAVAAGGFAYRSYVAEERRLAEQREHEEELRQEKVRAALEKGFLAAMGGDFEAADDAAREAEVSGASTGQIRMLRGQIALYQGHNEEAVKHLKQAAELLPESVAIRGMLAFAYGRIGDSVGTQSILQELEHLTATTPEDFLFKGLGEGGLDAQKGLATLDEAVRRRPSVVARLIRAEVRSHHLQQVDADPAAAELAIEDALAARQLLPDNPSALQTSLLTHVVALGAFERAGPEFRSRYDATLAQGERDLRALDRFRHIPDVSSIRYYFFRQVRRNDEAFKDLEQCFASSKSPIAAYYLALELYTRKRFADVTSMLEKFAKDFPVDVNRLSSIAELPDGPRLAYDIYQSAAKNGTTGWDTYNGLLVLCLLGRSDEAQREARQFLSRPEQFPPLRRDQFRQAVRFMAGELTQDELLRSPGMNRGDRTNAHLSIALKGLSAGDRQIARDHFEKALALGVIEFVPYDLSYIYLRRLDQDKSWPKWISPKK